MNVLLRVAREAKKYKGLFIIAALASLALTGVNLVTPWLMSSMTASVASGLNEEGVQSIFHLTFLLLGLYMLRVLFRYLSNFLAHKAAWQLVEELRMKVYQKLQALPIEYYRNHESGDLVSRTINDTGTFELLYAHLLPESITNFITVVGITTVLFIINPRLACLTCLPIPLILLSGWFFAKKVRPNFREMQQSLGALSGQLQDSFAGIHEIQAFGQQQRAAERVRKKTSAFTVSMLHALQISAIFHPSVEFITGLGSVFVVGFGGYLAYQQQANVGDIVAFMLYLSLFYTPITGLANLLEQLQQAMAGAERVIEVLDAPETIMNRPGAKPLTNCRGALRFDHVSFAYQPDVPILNDISFSANPGDMIALVGATGVGKTTLAQLTARFYDPDAGSIFLDDQNLKDIELESLHQHISMVMQDTFLFNGTIAENIAFARPSATREDIEGAARIARIHEDILAMPDGYETHVGERGAKLSGGQKQRIAIARAILCNAPVLILDEATASVDVQTEESIQQSIAELTGTRTILAIAHRLSTIQKASCILVLKDGRIVQRGTHQELIAIPGLYQEMCHIQQQGASLEQSPVQSY